MLAPDPPHVTYCTHHICRNSDYQNYDARGNLLLVCWPSGKHVTVPTTRCQTTMPSSRWSSVQASHMSS